MRFGVAAKFAMSARLRADSRSGERFFCVPLSKIAKLTVIQRSFFTKISNPL